jgi:hypothetical protein
MYLLKKYDSSAGEWVPTTPTSAAEIGAYTTGETDSKIAALQRTGTTAERPSDAVVGTVYFDTTLSKPIWCKAINPIVWVDGTGTVI